MEHEVFTLERNKSGLNNQELSYFLYGKEKKEMMEKIQEAISSDPILRFDPSTLGQSREQLYNHYMKKTRRMYELFDMNDFEVLGNAACMFPECLGLSLHCGMFISTLELLCDDNQRKKYYDRAVTNEILGCYAQTELGHGSDVQNLELEATFDKQKQQFIFHSPTVGSTKWWIGDLGLNANHVVTQAQIIVDGKRKGLGTFIVQIRSLEDHSVLEGVEVGDIGPKYGYNTKDNGFMRFTNYRTSKDSLLAKYMTINEQGKLQKVGNEKVSYGTMMKIRALILDQSYKYLGLSLTIATRYSLVRKQFKGEKQQERQIIEYQSQQNKIIPLLSLAYCQSQVYKKVIELVGQNIELNKNNDFSMLNSLHALISGLKAHFTTTSLEGLELLRSACGGHGYLNYSGLPQIMTEYSPTATYEGENTILLLQTARYLLKNYNRLNKNKELTPMTRYFKQYHTILEQKLEVNNDQLTSVDNIEKILIFNSLYRISLVAKKFMIHVINKMDTKIVWDQRVGIKLVDAALAHTHLMTYQIFRQSIQNIPESSSSKQVMTDLLLMYGIERILENPSGIYQGGYLSSQQFQYLRVKAKEELLLKIRPHLYRLVEGFNYSDAVLRSAIGMKNGKPYHNLFEWVTKHNPVNKPEIQQKIIKEWMGTPIPIHKPKI